MQYKNPIVTLVWHLGVKIVMKYAKAGFVILWCPSGPGFILGHENRNPEGGSQEVHKYIQGETICQNLPGKFFSMLLSARYFI